MLSAVDRAPRPRSAQPRVRVPGTARREHLLAAALELVAERDVDGLTLDALAERAGVSRALLYKHFDNRGVLLAALYEWTSTTLHEQLAGAVSQAPDVIEMFRSLLRAAMLARRERGVVLERLRSSAGANPALRAVHQERDRVTSDFFARAAAAECGVPPRVARRVTDPLLAGVNASVAQLNASSPARVEAALEEAYLSLVKAGLSHLRAVSAP